MAVGEDLFMFGSQNDGTFPVFRYRPSSDTWSRVATAPEVDYWPSSAAQAVGNSVYVLLPEDPNTSEGPPFLKYVIEP